LIDLIAGVIEEELDERVKLTRSTRPANSRLFAMATRCVTAEIGERLARAAERRLGVDDPIDMQSGEICC
jgi:hypothetical protein